MLLKANYLNARCHCKTLDKSQLATPQYFSEYPHFISRGDLSQIEEFIERYEKFLNAQANLPPIEKGIFNSFDFHITPQGPQLIEINTNAAGALLNLHAQEQTRLCCDGVLKRHNATGERLVKMFREEFARRFPARPLRTVAIVDDKPKEQYFFQEFELVRNLLNANGIEALILAPETLEVRDREVYAGDIPIDFIYNRTTDFYLTEARHDVLRRAFEEGFATVSPNPAVYERYALKSNLLRVREPGFDAFGSIDFLRAHVPETIRVSDENRERLWQTRKNWFFKPESGYGGKAVYRGDKLTQRVWSEIIKGGYLAQKLVTPDVRKITAENTMKYDLRVYTFGNEILGIVARYYQGQTTNFRTEHGGLATVMLAA